MLEVLTVFRRHPVVTALGVIVAILALFSVSFSIQPASGDSGPLLARKSYDEYSVDMQLMVVDARFNIGRAGRPEDGTWDAYSTTVLLAKTYANLLTSDVIRQLAESEVGTLRSAATAKSLEQSPLIDLSLTGDDPQRIRREGVALCDALAGYLKQQQDEHSIPADDRISVTMLSTSAVPVQTESRGWELALVALLAPLIGAASVGLLLDRGRVLKGGKHSGATRSA